jgi:hypothetical protein
VANAKAVSSLLVIGSGLLAVACALLPWMAVQGDIIASASRTGIDVGAAGWVSALAGGLLLLAGLSMGRHAGTAAAISMLSVAGGILLVAAAVFGGLIELPRWMMAIDASAPEGSYYFTVTWQAGLYGSILAGLLAILGGLLAGLALLQAATSSSPTSSLS